MQHWNTRYAEESYLQLCVTENLTRKYENIYFRNCENYACVSVVFM